MENHVSYDLFLKRRDGTYDPKQFLDYFRGREWYKINGNQAWYDNEDTGVYFSFELDDSHEGGDSEHVPIALNVNFFRPSYFILGVEPEVTALVHHFDMVVF